MGQQHSRCRAYWSDHTRSLTPHLYPLNGRQDAKADSRAGSAGKVNYLLYYTKELTQEKPLIGLEERAKATIGSVDTNVYTGP